LITWDKQGSTPQNLASVPNLILQPMIENALKHSFAQTVGDCSVTISGAIEGERLHLAVSDNGKGCDEQDVMNDPGIGLINI
jgi:LytS/YehU family sensor histidine kinase